MCKWYEINVQPRDTLFFRGAKPMGASAIGEGANWPMPSVYHQAMLSAFHEKWPQLQSWEHGHTKGNEKNPGSSCRFGGLQTVGVFPERDGRLYFPLPADVQFLNNDSDELCVLEPRRLEGKGDLPNPLQMGLFKPENAEATKRTPGRWISFADLIAYLDGKPLADRKTKPLFDAESRPGIGIDASTGTTGDGQFYMAESLRLRPGVALKAFATCGQVRYRDEKEPDDVLRRFFSGSSASFVFGGQRGIAHLQGVRDSETARQVFSPAAPQGRFIKWVTLTPSIFTGGWLPNWIDPQAGSIRAMETSKPARQPGESRKAWRARFGKKPIPGKLVAARIPKPIPYSGWKAQCGSEGPRPTRLCVPAGAVYYFEVPEGEKPQPLVRFLNGRRKSDIAAEKGFGFGLCGTWR